MELVLAIQSVKVFNHDGTYVFVSREDLPESYALQVRFEVEDVDVKVTPEYPDEDKRDELFDKADSENVLKMFMGIREQFFREVNNG